MRSQDLQQSEIIDLANERSDIAVRFGMRATFIDYSGHHGCKAKSEVYLTPGVHTNDIVTEFNIAIAECDNIDLKTYGFNNSKVSYNDIVSNTSGTLELVQKMEAELGPTRVNKIFPQTS